MLKPGGIRGGRPFGALLANGHTQEDSHSAPSTVKKGLRQTQGKVVQAPCFHHKKPTTQRVRAFVGWLSGPVGSLNSLPCAVCRVVGRVGFGVRFRVAGQTDRPTAALAVATVDLDESAIFGDFYQ